MENRSHLLRRGQKIRLSLIRPIYKRVSVWIQAANGKNYRDSQNKLVKEVRVNKWINQDAIVSVEEYITAKGGIAKSRCIIFDKYTGKHYATFHSVETILSFLEGQKDNAVGFNANQNAHRF